MKGKKILLCVTGGIAVFKAAALTSKLVQAGAEVKVMMTENAMKFVTPVTFQALSKNNVYSDTFQEFDAHSISHIDLADWCDIAVIAPGTANVIGKLANGIADDMVSTTLLATTSPIFLAPAMNVHMYENKAVCRNMNRLKEDGFMFIEPEEGQLACGYVGKGRLAEPEQIMTILQEYFNPVKDLVGRKIVVTAGPTRELVDPIRFFTNHSTGKMGYAIAEEAVKRGANVTLITGPTTITPPQNVTLRKITTAQEMFDEVWAVYEDADVVIKTAAVADYRPKYVYDEKMKKKDGDLMIELERTIDIIKTLGEHKQHQLLIGFAAETRNVEEYARQKIEKKNLDMIVANNVTEQGAGFGQDTNIVTFYHRDGKSKALPIMSKKAVAKEILDEVVLKLKE